MATANLNIRVVPRRMLSAKEAAEYCGLSAKGFELRCGVSPVQMPAGTRLYDMRDLDNWIDGLKAGGGDSDDDILRKLSG
ncbi:hypothetical protein [Shinella sp.]|uniref:hypothetical protein n=1 Tax=Shinella sp. TaxID=1870904 RepID=UPI0029A9A965|nr:hypothetical protein [Shinella sp.]MDX3975802.1 hypothetical protein [Shinella sp.]